jgi:hypothetical protein
MTGVTSVRDLAHIQLRNRRRKVGEFHDLDHIAIERRLPLAPLDRESRPGMRFFKDSGHLFRFAGLFVFAFLIFWGVRGFVVPKSFGKYGHYRAAAIDEIAARTPHFAGHEACEACHTEVQDVKKAGKHAHLNCEACHGPQGLHAADAGSVTPAKPDTAVLCARCHAASAARPKGFPQVKVDEHSSGVPCETCHQPHSPAIAAATAPAGGAK